jgi:hypothetical protein
MTIQQTVDIPANRQIHLDLTLPETFTPGTTLRLEINSSVITANDQAAAAKTKESMRAAIEGLCGLYAGLETPGAYLERHHADNVAEWAIEERRSKEREQWEK